MTTTVRLGEISFINALPLSLPCESLKEINLQKTFMLPTGLNRAMLNRELDLSPVSSAFYLRHKEQFVMLNNISISANNYADSVLLFLPQGFEGITRESLIMIPDASETSVALMQYLVFRQTGFIKRKEHLKLYASGEGVKHIEKEIPLLAIGDEALILKTILDQQHSCCHDLAQLWKQEMNQPFVFAVWVAQRDWADSNPDLLELINQKLVEHKNFFIGNISEQSKIVSAAMQSCPHLPHKLLQRYFTDALSYNLDTEQLISFLTFEKILQWLDNDNKCFTERNCSELSVKLLHC